MRAEAEKTPQGTLVILTVNYNMSNCGVQLSAVRLPDPVRTAQLN